MGVVVVGVDRSDASTRAQREAIRQTTWRDGSVVVGYVVQRPAYATLEFGVETVDSVDVEGVGIEAIAESFGDVESTFDQGFPVPVTSEVLVGHAGYQLEHEPMPTNRRAIARPKGVARCL